jgi:hypothetical protein
MVHLGPLGPPEFGTPGCRCFYWDVHDNPAFNDGDWGWEANAACPMHGAPIPVTAQTCVDEDVEHEGPACRCKPTVHADADAMFRHLNADEPTPVGGVKGNPYNYHPEGDDTDHGIPGDDCPDACDCAGDELEKVEVIPIPVEQQGAPDYVRILMSDGTVAGHVAAPVDRAAFLRTSKATIEKVCPGIEVAYYAKRPDGHQDELDPGPTGVEIDHADRQCRKVVGVGRHEHIPNADGELVCVPDPWPDRITDEAARRIDPTHECETSRCWQECHPDTEMAKWRPQVFHTTKKELSSDSGTGIFAAVARRWRIFKRGIGSGDII